MIITQEITAKTIISEDIEEIISPPSDLYSDKPPEETELHLISPQKKIELVHQKKSAEPLAVKLCELNINPDRS